MHMLRAGPGGVVLGEKGACTDDRDKDGTKPTPTRRVKRITLVQDSHLATDDKQ